MEENLFTGTDSQIESTFPLHMSSYVWLVVSVAVVLSEALWPPAVLQDEHN